MSKHTRFVAVVVGVLLLLAGLYLGFGHLAHEREAEIARLTGDDEQTMAIRSELEAFQLQNRNEQRVVLVTGAVVVVVVGVWWMGRNSLKSGGSGGRDGA